ncbi:MAG: homoserine dehydrogenase [Actinobacteria bacterium]|nr:homoserine dehydrogenase [Actinomycetota bacterium]
MNGRPVRVGLLGCGNVGGALAELIVAEGAAVAERTGVRLEITRVGVRDLAKARPASLPDGVLTDDAEAVVSAADVDVVVETIGGVEPARTLLLDALKAGKPVVSANKELLAVAAAEMFEAAAAAGVDLLFEAAVAGGIPLIRPLRESLAGERLTRVMGIVNGTTNYILTRMAEEGASYEDALAEAQRLGYAEPDPTADVDGLDAAAKAAIIAGIAFGGKVVAGDVYTEGIRAITARDIAFADQLGYVVKLLAIADQVEGRVAVRVHPAMVPKTHPLASVRESFNALFIEGEAVGELMLYGRGAGGMPTASALLGDLIDAAHNLRAGGAGRAPALGAANLRPVDELNAQYYFTVDVLDRPGVLEQVAGVTARHDVSIQSMVQDGMGDEARLIFISHTACERDMQATLDDLRHLDVVERVGTLLRVIRSE